MSEVLKMYPSGFLGSAAVEQTTPVDVVQQAKSMFNPGLKPKVSHYLANQKIQDLWTMRHAGVPESKTFEFCEEMLKAAKYAFGTDTLLKWIGTQVDSPYYSQYHRDWIDDTLGYVMDQQPRRMSGNNWSVFLNVNQREFQGERFSRVVKHYLLGEKLHSAPYAREWRGNMTVTEFIGLWVMREGGLADMIDQLHTVFGKR